MEIKLVGTTFAVRACPGLKHTAPLGEVEFVRNTEYDKPDDPPEHRGVMAINDGIHIGWLGKGTAEQEDANILLDRGELVTGEITEADYSSGKPYCNVELDWDGVSETTDTELPLNVEPLASFNEEGVVVLFDEQAHTYTYNGQYLKGATSLTKDMYAPFEKEAIAKKCAGPWGMTTQDIVKMWEDNGSAAAMFGSSIHLMMENYTRFGERALPKMPFLRDIVLSFPHDDSVKVHPEVLLSAVALGMCGLCDRLVEINGVYRVEDYKFNYGAFEPDKKMVCKAFPDLPNCKFGKYVLQMSIYADMAERSGLPVHDEVVAHVWDGKWHNESHPRIKDVINTLLAVDAGII